MHSPATTDRADALAHRVCEATLAAMPDVVARLESIHLSRIADVGCGQGLSTVALAHAFLDAHVDGIDSDPASIADARRHAAATGLDGRVRFLNADATELVGPYDLILILEALHDLARPLDALRAARDALADQAGPSGFEVLPVENDFFRLYRLHP
jgi:2-polyprenyl-3-methyl-5-hydroxy-6-metoxy-1,4-benzoquinol methylase